MPDQILFDRLTYIDRLKRAGIAEDQARAHAEAMDDALREAVATRTDILVLKADIESLRTVTMKRHCNGEKTISASQCFSFRGRAAHQCIRRM